MSLIPRIMGWLSLPTQHCQKSPGTPWIVQSHPKPRFPHGIPTVVWEKLLPAAAAPPQEGGTSLCPTWIIQLSHSRDLWDGMDPCRTLPMAGGVQSCSQQTPTEGFCSISLEWDTPSCPCSIRAAAAAAPGLLHSGPGTRECCWDGQEHPACASAAGTAGRHSLLHIALQLFIFSMCLYFILDLFLFSIFYCL